MINLRPFIPSLLLLYHLVAQIMCQGTTVHRDMSKKELHHIFGVKDAKDVPDYHIVHPVETYFSKNKHELLVEHGDKKFEFLLKPHHHLLSEHLISTIRLHNATVQDKLPQTSNCVYLGKATNVPNTRISLVGCGNRMRGFIITGNEYLFLHPLLSHHLDNEGSSTTKPTKATHPHVIYKRSAPNFHPVNSLHNQTVMLDDNNANHKACLFSEQDDPYPETNPLPIADNLLSRHTLLTLPEHTMPREERLFSRFREERLPVIKGPLTIELGVFADDAMWQHFQELYKSDAEAELQQFSLAAVNNIHLLYSHKSIDPKINMRITKYEVMKDTPTLIDKRRHRNGEVDLLLEGFCQHQDNINEKSDADPSHWDHALLFSGYDLYRGNLKSVAGYAPVKGMCSGIRSCTINEGLDFGAVFVVTHEMGHSLGMYHDGDNGCDSRCCIMSPSVGSGKTSWSQCSVSEFTRFVTKLGTGFLPDNCLVDGTFDRILLDHSQGTLPGQKYTLEQQCRIFHGECWTHELRDGQDLHDVCDMVWCGAGEGVIRTAHPALEGTYCGDNKWCMEGMCANYRGTRPRKVDGDWSEWNDRPGGACGAGCSTCSIASQLRVRRSVRLCEKPAPNNGGKDCRGSLVRGLVCEDRPCSGKTPDKYASDFCAKLRGDSSTPDLLLSGKGFQYTDSPCKIWCHMTVNNFIRSVGNFPDGTPCGNNKFCVKGQCQTLDCERSAVVEDDLDCPPVSRRVDQPAVFKPPSPPRIQAPVTAVLKQPSWSSWSPWSACSRSCGRGLQVRIRRCTTGGCSGNARQAIPCQTISCPFRSRSGRPDRPPEILQSLDSGWSEWDRWSACDATCNGGRQIRKRRCLAEPCDGLRFEFQACGTEGCPLRRGAEEWSSWASWSECTRNCGGGIQTRLRACDSRVCDEGSSSQARACNRHRCSRDDSDSLKDAEWTHWSGWSSCSRTCSGGTQFRRRHCRPGQGTCYGSNIDYSSCNTQSCNIGNILQFSSPHTERRKEALGKWTDWSPWGACSSSCGGGLRKRSRLCFNAAAAACFGTPVQTEVCNKQPCRVKDDPAIAAQNHGLLTIDNGLVPLFGEWGEWGGWLTCSCRSQSQKRFRRCQTNPPCPGAWDQSQYCSIAPCPAATAVIYQHKTK